MIETSRVDFGTCTGRKLLILGANRETIPLVQTAKQMGVRTIVTDHVPGSPAKQIADMFWDVDGTAVEELAERARLENVDGVMVGVADRLVRPYASLCHDLNLPCYGTEAQCGTLNDKAAFNDTCRLHGVGIIPAADKDTWVNRPANEHLQNPVFVKPVDCNSGKGMSICRTAGEVSAAIRKAISFSASGKYLAERYMECDDTAVHLTIVNGNVFLSAIVDRFTTTANGRGSRVCTGALYPSKHMGSYLTTTHPSIVAVLNHLGIKNGLLTMQAFVVDGIFHVYDPGFRLQGEGCDKHFCEGLGYDQKEMLIRFALTGEMKFYSEPKTREWPDSGLYGATAWLLCRSGRISAVHGLERVATLTGVFAVGQRLFPGDVITDEMEGTELQVLARVYCQSTSEAELKHQMRLIYSSVTVLDDEGQSMMLNALDASCDALLMPGGAPESLPEHFGA